MVWLPVSLECVNTDGSIFCDIGVEYLGEEEALGWTGRKVSTQNQLHPKHSTLIRSTSWEEVNL